MIEPKVPGLRSGRGYIAAAYYKGSFVKMDGVFTANEIAALPTGQKSIPGYASTGPLKLTQVTSAAAGQRGMVFPINKLIFKPEDSDSDSELIPAGSSVIFYEGGEYETDQFLDVSGTDSDFGDNLEITVSGKLTETTETDDSTQIVAKVIGISYGDSYNDEVMGQNHTKDRLWYKLLTG